MKTFARINDGLATDVCYGDHLDAALTSSFAADYVKKCGAASWKSMPDGVKPNAKVTLDEAGKVTDFENPPGPEPEPGVLVPGPCDVHAALCAIAKKLDVELPPITGA